MRQSDLQDENKRLREALLDACASLVGDASAYRKHAARHKSAGRAVADPFFKTRADDFDKAAGRALVALSPTSPPPEAPPKVRTPQTPENNNG